VERIFLKYNVSLRYTVDMTFAKKKFGQNFLKSEKALDVITNASSISDESFVLEIGPGRGALTKKLLETGAKVRAIEIDPEMIAVLQEDFANEIETKQLELIEGDIQKISPRGLMGDIKKYSLVANIPYYITGLIIRTFLESDHAPTAMTLLVQKEVAVRIVDGHADGKRGKENILSLSVKAFGDVRYVATVPSTAFVPAPRIDSAVIHISHISHNKFKESYITPGEFFYVVKSAFAQKRKTLRNNLSQKGFEREEIEAVLIKMDIDLRVRAEDLTLEQWIALTKNLGTSKKV